MLIPQLVFRRIYASAKSAEDLPWHRDRPPPLLVRAVEGLPSGARALDVGCGAGVFSTWLAQRGLQVTGVDFTAAALRMARERADGERVSIEFVEADVTAFSPREPFDLVFDSGCLHSLPMTERPAYLRRLFGTWLARGGDYVLVHFGRRHPLDWRPIGPVRRTRAEILAELSPELSLDSYDVTIDHTPLPIGPSVQIATYWFRDVRGPDSAI